ncbi:MAG: DUF1015 domain-containing protein [Thermodesulfobacteriota bacterium]
MPEVRGFKGIRYNPDKIKDFGSVLAPPYDVISPREQEEFHESNPLNVIRLILPKGEGDIKYDRAAKSFRDWFLENILIQDPEPSIYPYYQEFEDNGKKFTRKGFIARVKLEDFSTKKILPHERTFPKHKLDRLKLNTACRSNMSPVFSVYSDPDGDIEKLIDEKLPEKPVFDISYRDGIKNRLWKISDASVISYITDKMTDMSFLIADGHHRYETALEYRNLERAKKDGAGEEPFDFVMMYISRAEGEGLIINPTHRVIKNLGTYTVDGFLERLREEFKVGKMPVQAGISDIGYKEFTIVTKDPESTYRVSSPKTAQPDYANLGVMLLHNIVFNKILNEEESGIFYTKYLDEALELMRHGDYELAFILPELRANDIFEVVLAGERMPHKTTYFYPKILSGLTFNPLW